MEPINSFAYLIMTLDGMSIECCCHLSSCISFCSYPSAILFESVVIVVVKFGANLVEAFITCYDLSLKWPFFPLEEVRLQ